MLAYLNNAEIANSQLQTTFSNIKSNIKLANNRSMLNDINLSSQSSFEGERNWSSSSVEFATTSVLRYGEQVQINWMKTIMTIVDKNVDFVCTIILSEINKRTLRILSFYRIREIWAVDINN